MYVSSYVCVVEMSQIILSKGHFLKKVPFWFVQNPSEREMITMFSAYQ